MCGRLSSQHQGSRPLTVYTPDNQSILHSGNGPFSQSSPLVLLPCCLSNSRSKFKSRQKALLMNPCSHNCYACRSSNDNEPQFANMKYKYIYILYIIIIIHIYNRCAAAADSISLSLLIRQLLLPAFCTSREQQVSCEALTIAMLRPSSPFQRAQTSMSVL